MEKFYVTTAIDYVNSRPHCGHSYQKIIADVLARWHKLKGEDVFFLTGTDEHGQKVDRAAREAGLSPKEFVDKMSVYFKEAWERLNINPERFIRTTDKDHEKTAQEITKMIWKNGDIYKGFYEGLYCTGCEAYFTERDAVDGKCPIHKKKLEVLKEETYFFRLSKYQDRLLDYYEKHHEFILPFKRRNEIINRVKEGLKDLSITRTSFSWGIPFPFDKKHAEYVWWEALINYISGIDWPDEKFKKYWPADLHILGVDNGWFHCVIWPAMLFSAGIEPPKTVFIHGFLTINGQKISKSLGNVIDPNYLIKKYGSDTIRYSLVRETPFGEDGDFSEQSLKNRHNNELLNDLGNLLSRVVTLIDKGFSGKIPKRNFDKKLAKELNLEGIEKHMESFELHNALAEIWNFIRACNKYINDKEPWKLEGDELSDILYTLTDSLRIIAILLSPFIPETSGKINEQLGLKAGELKDVKFGLLKKGKIKKGEHLFKKIK